MSNSVPLDIRVVTFIIKWFDKYVTWRKMREMLKSDKSWLDLFKNKDSIIHPLTKDLNIRLYKDSVLSKFIFDEFETTEINFLNDFLTEGDCFLDIGANVGLFTLYASKRVGLSGTVLAFEPSLTTYARLIENIELNKLPNIKPYKMGLSDQETFLDLNISVNGYEAWNTFVQSEDNRFSKKEQVPVKPLDLFLEEHPFNPDGIVLIKLDVEGFELNVLNGAKKILSLDNAPVFLVEFTDANAIAAGHCCHEIYRLLNSYGYTWYIYDPVKKVLKYDP